MKRNLSIYIKDILENMKNAELFVENITYEEFIKDKKTHYAVERCIEIIGEAAKNIPDEVRNKFSEIQWKEMAGMRDKVINFYFGIDLKKVWMVIKKDIPKLKPSLEVVLEEVESMQ